MFLSYLCMIIVLGFLFSVVYFWESLFFGNCAGTILIWLWQRKKKYLKGSFLGTCFLQTRWWNHMKVLLQNFVLDLQALSNMIWVKLTQTFDTWMVTVIPQSSFNKIHIHFKQKLNNYIVKISSTSRCSLRLEFILYNCKLFCWFFLTNVKKNLLCGSHKWRGFFFSIFFLPVQRMHIPDLSVRFAP